MRRARRRDAALRCVALRLRRVLRCVASRRVAPRRRPATTRFTGREETRGCSRVCVSSLPHTLLADDELRHPRRSVDSPRCHTLLRLSLSLSLVIIQSPLCSCLLVCLSLFFSLSPPYSVALSLRCFLAPSPSLLSVPLLSAFQHARVTCSLPATLPSRTAAERDERDANGANFRPRIDFLSESSRRHRVARIPRSSRAALFGVARIARSETSIQGRVPYRTCVCDRSCANVPPLSHPLVRSAIQSGSEVARAFFKSFVSARR